MHHRTTTTQPAQLTAREVNETIGDAALVGWLVAACVALACWLAR